MGIEVGEQRRLGQGDAEPFVAQGLLCRMNGAPRRLLGLLSVYRLNLLLTLGKFFFVVGMFVVVVVVVAGRMKGVPMVTPHLGHLGLGMLVVVVQPSALLEVEPALRRG